MQDQYSIEVAIPKLLREVKDLYEIAKHPKFDSPKMASTKKLVESQMLDALDQAERISINHFEVLPMPDPEVNESTKSVLKRLQAWCKKMDRMDDQAVGLKWIPDREKDAYLFACENATWRIMYKDQEVTVNTSKGMSYLMQLLKKPGQRIACLDLEKHTKGGMHRGSRDASREEEGQLFENGVRGEERSLHDTDTETQNNIQRNIAELQERLDIETDPSEIAGLKEKVEQLEKYLQETTNIHGRPRESSPQEASRSRVKNAIALAVKKINKANPVIGLHFKASIRPMNKGYVYIPEEKIPWNFS